MRFRVLGSALLAAFVVACGGDERITEPKPAPSLKPLAAIGTDPVTGATIETNLDDYLPGGTISLVGRGWAPNEKVHLAMSETPDTHPDVSKDVQTDGSGAFSIEFYVVQASDLGATFTLTGTGETSGSTVAVVFTDGRNITSFTLNGASSVTVAPGTSITVNALGVLTGNSNNTLGSIGVKVYLDGTLPTSASVSSCFNVDPDIGPSSPSAPVPFNQSFSFTGPTAAGTYDVDVAIYSDNSCTATSGSDVLTHDKGIKVQATNTPPTLNAIGNKAVNEGSTLTFTASASDTDTPAQTLKYSLVGAPVGATIDENSGAFSWTPTDGPTQTVTFTVKVNDGNPGLSDEEQIAVTVNNVAPTATFNAPPSAAGGSNIALSLTSPVDPSSVDVAAGFTYAFDCGDGSGYGALSSTSTASCPTSGGTGSRNVKGKIQDKDGDYTEYPATVGISNVAPTSLAGGPYSGNEGSAISVTGSGNDPDGGSVTFLWTAPSACTFASATSASTSVTCNDNGSYTLTLTVKDDEGSETPSTASLTVANVAPTATFNAPSSVDEGSSISLSLTSPVDPSTADVGAGFTYFFDCGTGSGYGSGSSTNTHSCATTDNGSRTVKGKIQDKDGESTEYTATVAINNVAPTVSAGGNASINEGATFTRNGSFTDPGADTWTATVNYGDGSPAQALTLGASKTFNLSHEYADNGVFTVTVTVTDDDGGVGPASFTVTVNNVAPTVSAGADATMNEGSTFTRSGSFVDPGTDTWTATVDYGDGSGAQSLALSGKNFSLSHTYADNGNYTITVTVTDDDSGAGTDVVALQVDNVAPSITGVTVPLNPVAAGQNNVTVTWTFTDPGADTWGCQISWDIGQPFEPLSPTFAANPTKTCSSTKTLSAGIYTVTVKVTDDDNGSDSKTAATYIVVYDPNGGFVTGGGWITSLAGNCQLTSACGGATGKANFGFVAKYKKGQTAPDGNTEFQFQAGNLNFSSTSYDWLVVAGTKAQYKGVGTINGFGTYTFLLTAVDGDTKGSPDMFRMKIWKTVNGVDQVVYDNQMGSIDDSNPTTAIGGGSIQIHDK
jgi:hypothetical protein